MILFGLLISCLFFLCCDNEPDNVDADETPNFMPGHVIVTLAPNADYDSTRIAIEFGDAFLSDMQYKVIIVAKETVFDSILSRLRNSPFFEITAEDTTIRLVLNKGIITKKYITDLISEDFINDAIVEFIPSLSCLINVPINDENEYIEYYNNTNGFIQGAQPNYIFSVPIDPQWGYKPGLIILGLKKSISYDEARKQIELEDVNILYMVFRVSICVTGASINYLNNSINELIKSNFVESSISFKQTVDTNEYYIGCFVNKVSRESEINTLFRTLFGSDISIIYNARTALVEVPEGKETYYIDQYRKQENIDFVSRAWTEYITVR